MSDQTGLDSERPNECNTCQFWFPTEQQFGRCQRHPPTVNEHEKRRSRWPVTTSGDWCGEFRVMQWPIRWAKGADDGMVEVEDYEAAGIPPVESQTASAIAKRRKPADGGDDD